MAAPSIVPNRLAQRIFLLFALLVLLPWGAVTLATLTAGHQHLAPESLLRLQAVGRTLAQPIERALGYGIAPDELIGMDDFLDQGLSSSRGLYSIVVRGPRGRVVYERVVPRRTDAAAPSPGRSVAVPIIHNEDLVAELVLTEQASETDRLYAPALRNLAIALILALVVGYESIRFLTSVLLLAPLRLGEVLIGAIGAGDLRSVAGRAAMGGEIGGLLSAVNRVARRLIDRCEDIRFYAREVRVGLPPADAARVDQAVQSATTRFRIAATVQEMQPVIERPVRDFAGFLVTTALVLQLPAFLAIAQPLGRTVPVAALAVGAAAALLLGPVWNGLRRLLGVRLAILGALLLTLIPLVPWQGLPGEVALGLRILGFVCVLSVLRPADGEEDDAEDDDLGDALRWNVHGLVAGFGMMALWTGPVSEIWPAALLIAGLSLMMLSHRGATAPSPPRRAGFDRRSLSPRVFAAFLLLLSGYAYAFGRGAELLGGNDPRWTEPVFFAAAVAAGFGVIRLFPRDPAHALSIAAAGLLLVPLVIIPMIVWSGNGLVPHALAAGAIMGLAELACLRLLADVPGATTLVRRTTWLGALLGLLLVSGYLPPSLSTDLRLTPLLAAAIAGLTWLGVSIAERGRARHG